ncbi:MAG: sterol desaturase family protein, partial [Polymorphobacter sp.]
MEILRHIQLIWPPWAFEFFKFGNGLLLLALVFVPLERLFAARPQPVRRTGWKTDIVYYFLSSLLPPKLVVMAVLALVLAMEAWAPRGLFPTLADLPLWLRFPLAVLIAEVGFYWGHRWMHASAWLWRFHAVHHSADQLDWLVNTRAHPLDLILTRLCGLLPLYLLGLVQVSGAGIDSLPLFVALATSAWGYFIHANLQFDLVMVQPLVSTPAFHQWHHAKAGAGGRHHRNFAAMLPAIDWLFGTYQHAGTARPQNFGTTEAVPANIVDQLMAPFMG